MTTDKLYIIDTIGPFFKPRSSKTMNWSKIPFSRLEKHHRLNTERQQHIIKEFEQFLNQAHAMGYNAISIDDLPHLVQFDFYSQETQKIINTFIQLYRQLFDCAARRNMKIFVNADIMFYNKEIKKYKKAHDVGSIELLKQAVKQCLDQFPVSGLIFRIGESDGVDVKGLFKSRLKLQTPKEVNACIHTLLPLFEARNRLLIFRTWTVGIFPIGDLMWNKKTYDRTFRRINSPNFIVSMKYGDTDFYSGLSLNPLFFHGGHKKIIELQTRREREGFGEFPYYVGYEYENHARALQNLDRLAGINVWCQTGGWTRWNNRTFLDNSSPWNELNTFSAIQIFKNHQTAEWCIEAYMGSSAWIPFLKKFYLLFKEILYSPEAFKGWYFRRLRIPPCLWIYWDYITLSSFILAFYRFIDVSPLQAGSKEVEEIRALGERLKIDTIQYYADVLNLLIEFRKALNEPCSKSRLVQLSQTFKQKYPDSFKFRIHSVECIPRWQIFLFHLILRSKPQYRLIDRILLTPGISRIIQFLLTKNQKNLPKFVNKRAMNIKLIFK